MNLVRTAFSGPGETGPGSGRAGQGVSARHAARRNTLPARTRVAGLEQTPLACCYVGSANSSTSMTSSSSRISARTSSSTTFSWNQATLARKSSRMVPTSRLAHKSWYHIDLHAPRTIWHVDASQDREIRLSGSVDGRRVVMCRCARPCPCPAMSQFPAVGIAVIRAPTLATQ